MSDFLYQFIALDLPPMLTATFAAMSCALLGNFLVLRRLSLMGDAISHAVLPGIVVAFLVTGSRSALPIFLGAACAGIVTVLLVELVRRFGRLESGAAMGVVFSILFAIGVLLMEQASARNIDLDADCLLHGQLETIFWYPPRSLAALFSFQTILQLPVELLVSIAIFIVASIFVVAFMKELTIAAFDPALATSLGFHAGGLHYLLMVLVAGAVVASFEAVGSILVIAMILCPPATARLCTDRLRVQMVLSLLYAALSGIVGYLVAAFVPMAVGFESSVNAAGMISVISGVLLAGAVVFAPNHGIVSKQLRRIKLTLRVLREDLLALIFRAEELQGGVVSLPRDEVLVAVGGGILPGFSLNQLLRDSDLNTTSSLISLTDSGRKKARKLVRSHRLWESYLVNKLGLKPDHVHKSAEQLEHFSRGPLDQQLAEEQRHPASDPHGRVIPKDE